MSHGQIPPFELLSQVDYYKDVIRDVYNLIQPKSASKTTPSPQSTVASYPRSLLTPATSSTQDSPESKRSPEVRQHESTDKEKAAEVNSSNVDIHKSINPQLSTAGSPRSGSLSKVVHLGQQDLVESSTKGKSSKSNTMSSNTSDTGAGLMQSVDKSNPSKAQADLRELLGGAMSVNQGKGLGYTHATGRSQHVFEAASPTDYNKMTSLVNHESLMNFAGPEASSTPSVTRAHDPWSNAPEMITTAFTCQFCSDSGFFDHATGPQLCAFCDYMSPGPGVPT